MATARCSSGRAVVPFPAAPAVKLTVVRRRRRAARQERRAASKSAGLSEKNFAHGASYLHFEQVMMVSSL
jgi:hypothetical protein